MAGPVTIRVPATTANLGPGFDCLGMALSVYNTVSLEETKGGLEIRVSGDVPHDSVPLDQSNLVYRAINSVFDVAGRKHAGLTIGLELNAPLARGMGSSASAIVGGMMAANEVLGRPLTPAALLARMVAMEGHPDNIVPAVVGGLTASLQLEGEVMYQRIKPSSTIRCILLIPDYELSTARARQAIPKSIPLKDAVFNLARIPFILSSLESGDLTNLSSFMDDRLHQPYRRELIRGYDAVEAAALNAGAAAVCISGAGPTILAIAEADCAAKIAEVMQACLVALETKSNCIVIEPDLQGTILL